MQSVIGIDSLAFHDPSFNRYMYRPFEVNLLLWFMACMGIPECLCTIEMGLVETRFLGMQQYIYFTWCGPTSHSE